MRHSLLYLFALLGVMTALTSCFSPRTVVVIDADQDAIKWSYGRQIIDQKKDSLEAAIYFDTYNKKDLVFDVEVTNWGKESVLVSPENIYLKCANSEAEHLAYDPEKVLLNQAIDASRHEANSKNLAIAVGVAAIATIVAVAVTDNGGNGNNGGNDFNNGGNITFISTYVVPPLPAPALPPSMDFWENYSLRKTTLEQNYKVGGKVVLPRLDYCPALEVYVPVGNEVFIGRFKQRIVQP